MECKGVDLNMDVNESVENLYIYHTYACVDSNDEFSVQLYDFSTHLETGKPVKRITCFDELIAFLDETD